MNNEVSLTDAEWAQFLSLSAQLRGLVQGPAKRVAHEVNRPLRLETGSSSRLQQTELQRIRLDRAG